VLERFTDADVHVAILCNRGDANPQALALAMLDGLLPLAAAPSRIAGPGDQAPLAMEPGMEAGYTGLWVSEEVGGTLRTSLRDGRLVVTSRPGRGWTMERVGADSFVAGGGQRLQFRRDSAGRPDRLIMAVSRALGLEYVRLD